MDSFAINMQVDEIIPIEFELTYEELNEYYNEALNFYIKEESL